MLGKDVRASRRRIRSGRGEVCKLGWRWQGSRRSKKRIRGVRGWRRTGKWWRMQTRMGRMKGKVVWVKARAKAKRVGRLPQCKRDRGGIADAPLLTVPPV